MAIDTEHKKKVDEVVELLLRDRFSELAQQIRSGEVSLDTMNSEMHYTDASNLTPVIVNTAVHYRAYEPLIAWLEMGGNPNIKTGADFHFRGASLLMLTMMHGPGSPTWDNPGKRLQIVELFISKGADLDATDRNGNTALHAAAEDGNAEIVALLLDKGANPNITDTDGETALMVAMRKGRFDVMKEFDKRGIKLDIQTGKGMTALMYAAGNYLKGAKKTEAVGALIAAGANLDMQDAEGNTALMHACEQNDVEVVDLLLTAGADVTLQNKAGKRAIEIGHLDKIKDMVQKRLDALAAEESKAAAAGKTHRDVKHAAPEQEPVKKKRTGWFGSRR